MGIELKFRIVQLDEFVVTKNTKPKQIWTLPKNNIDIDYKSINI